MMGVRGGIARSFSALVLLGAALGLSLPPASAAGWRDEIGTFRIGLVMPRGSDPDRGRTLEKAFSEALSMKAEVVPYREYRALIDAHLSGRIEYAVYSATAFALAWQLCECVEPVAAPLSQDGTTGFRSALFLDGETTAGSPSLQGKRIGYTTRQSLSGWLIPTAAFDAGERPLAESGATFHAMEDYAKLIGEFSGGRVDGFFGWIRDPEPQDPTLPEGSMSSPAKLARHGLPPERYTIAWRSDPVPFGPHAVRKNLAPEAAELLTAFLTGLREKQPEVYEALEPTHDGGFRPVGLTDYRLLMDLARDLSGGETPDAAGGSKKQP